MKTGLVIWPDSPCAVRSPARVWVEWCKHPEAQKAFDGVQAESAGLRYDNGGRRRRRAVYPVIHMCNVGQIRHTLCQIAMSPITCSTREIPTLAICLGGQRAMTIPRSPSFAPLFSFLFQTRRDNLHLLPLSLVPTYRQCRSSWLTCDVALFPKTSNTYPKCDLTFLWCPQSTTPPPVLSCWWWWWCGAVPGCRGGALQRRDAAGFPGIQRAPLVPKRFDARIPPDESTDFGCWLLLATEDAVSCTGVVDSPLWACMAHIHAEHTHSSMPSTSLWC